MKLYEAPISLLAKLASTGNLPHALLFTGDDEAYTKKTAWKFAQWLLHKGTELKSGGADFPDFLTSECSCISCAQVARLWHPDFYLSDNEQLSIGEVREIIAKFSLTPFVASRKIAIISHADRMADAAANAFLKILEEPRGNTLFILIANARSNLLATIASRVLEVRFVATRETLLKRYFESGPEDVPPVLQCFKMGALYKKSELCAILDIWLLKLREKIMAANVPDTNFALKQILDAKKMLMTSNVNQELLMEELHVKFHSTQYA